MQQELQRLQVENQNLKDRVKQLEGKSGGDSTPTTPVPNIPLYATPAVFEKERYVHVKDPAHRKPNPKKDFRLSSNYPNIQFIQYTTAKICHTFNTGIRPTRISVLSAPDAFYIRDVINPLNQGADYDYLVIKKHNERPGVFEQKKGKAQKQLLFWA